jgi:hypothetical protein
MTSRYNFGFEAIGSGLLSKVHHIKVNLFTPYDDTTSVLNYKGQSLLEKVFLIIYYLKCHLPN